MTDALVGKRILLVEDEYFIASDLKRALQCVGAEVLGPVGELDAGLVLAEQPADAAVLDVNLAGVDSYAIADRLAERGTPVMFLTGYDAWAMPDAYQAVPRMAKPFAMQVVLDMLKELLAAPARADPIRPGR